MEHRYLVSAIIPCRNEERHIEGVILNLLAVDLPEIELEIIVVDGRSTDGTRKILETLQLQFHNITVVDNPKMITPAAFNLGINAARGEYFFIVGARHLISKNYISRSIDALNKDADLAGVGGRVINLSENARSLGIANAMSSPLGVGMGNYRVAETEVFVDTIGTPVYRKSVFSEIGYFDEVLVRNQDDELNYRIRKAGYKLKLLPDINISYYVRDDFYKLFKQYFQYGYWKVYVNKKHKTITTFRQVVPSIFVSCVAIGAFLAFIKPLNYIYFFFSALYLVLLLSAAIFRSNSVKVVAFTFFSFLCLHFGYGLGYLNGLFDFVLLGRDPSENMKDLTR